MKIRYLIPLWCTLIINSLFAAFLSDWKSVQQAETLSVYMNSQSVGAFVSTVKVNGSHIETVSDLESELTGRNSKIVASVIEKRTYDTMGTLVSAYEEMSSPAGKNMWKLGKNSTGKWQITVTTSGVENSRSVDKVCDDVMSTYRMYKGILASSIKVGESWIDTSIELTSGDLVYVKTRCAQIPQNENGNVYKFIENNSVTGKDEEWILDRNGNTISRGMFPFVLKRKQNTENDTGKVDIFESFKIPMSKAAGDNERIIVSGDSGFKIDTSVSWLYKNINGKYALFFPENNCRGNVNFRCPDSLKKYLSATPTMQADHPDIRKLAEQFSREKDICKRIASMNSYVFKSLRKVYTATFSSALETYKSGFGDCGEHAVLLAALLRSSGIPARVTFGLIYQSSQKGYFYHAWVMAFDGSGWKFVDPAFGVFPADFDRVPLFIDDTGERMIALASVIGRIKIEYSR